MKPGRRRDKMKTLVYGNIYTMDPIHPFAQAMWIEDGIVQAVGTRIQFDG